MKIVVACDSFKECMGSLQVADAVEAGILSVFPEAVIVKIEVGDGGEGTAGIITRMLKGTKVAVGCVDPLGREVDGWYGRVVVDGIPTAVLDVATASGLHLVAPDERMPMRGNSFGTGVIIRKAVAAGIRKIIVGLGGSATIDGGIGIMSALGFRFIDADGNDLLPVPENLSAICDIIIPEDKALKKCEFTILSDVSTIFSGSEGCAYIFGKQKGASSMEMSDLDKGLDNLRRIMFAKSGIDLNRCPGSGAAGGIGGCMVACFNAELKQGAGTVLELAHFNEKLQGADFVITGEGRIDRTTKMGKIPYIVMQEARRNNIAVSAICGSVSPDVLEVFEDMGSVFPIVPRPISLKDAIDPENARRNIERTVAQIMHLYRMSRTV